MKPVRLLLLAGLAALSFVSVGCTHVAKITVTPASFPAGGTPKVAAPVALVLDDEFKRFKHQHNMMGDTFVLPLGTPLERYAQDVTGQVFSKVTIHSTPQAAANSAADVLQPRVVKFDQSIPVTAFGDRTALLIVEWTLRDRSGRNTLWLTTINSRVAEQAGNLFTHKEHEKKLFQKLFDDLSQKTYEAMSTSPDVRRLAP